MQETEIVNCHVHTFTTAHTPRCFPSVLVVVVRAFPGLITLLRWGAEALGRERSADYLRRIELFHRTGKRRSQRAVFREVLHHYPRTTRFVVLPLDMSEAGHGPVARDIVAQHDELASLAADPDYGAQVIPFAGVDPRRAGVMDELRRCVDDLGFRGVKIYPRMGFRPDHPVLMDEVYPFCLDRNLPVMSHCSRGGVWRKGWLPSQQDAVTAPQAHEPVLRAFPDLRLCLAHFGGDRDWRAHLRDGVDPDDPDARERNWSAKIARLLKDRTYSNLYTDISYTIFRFADHMPLLRLHLAHPHIRERVLFGSDFYMTRQEELSEKAVSIRLRDALGEDLFHQIAHVNPRRWLGEA
ncbi:amidohydrolase family protein [Palleronia sp. KMU-117]|uniref:amidohydrolase family protein n=1 Tax=Palleronia sp. KMU-117 TaxID=3434108 RepID=UPI003D73D504